jgi:hypothetical protein
MLLLMRYQCNQRGCQHIAAHAGSMHSHTKGGFQKPAQQHAANIMHLRSSATRAAPTMPAPTTQTSYGSLLPAVGPAAPVLPVEGACGGAGETCCAADAAAVLQVLKACCRTGSNPVQPFCASTCRTVMQAISNSVSLFQLGFGCVGVAGVCVWFTGWRAQVGGLGP